MTETTEGSPVLSGLILDITEQRAAERRAKLLTAVVEWVGEAAEMPVSYTHLTLPTIERCRSRWSPYH